LREGWSFALNLAAHEAPHRNDSQTLSLVCPPEGIW